MSPLLPIPSDEIVETRYECHYCQKENEGLPMMQVEPTCRFCQGKMLANGTRGYSTSNYYPHHYRVVSYIYLCKRCHSEQVFAIDGQALDYEFMAGHYQLKFDPKVPSLAIIWFPLDGKMPKYIGKPIVTIKSCPTHLTPQNTTEERVKKLILFS